MKKLSYLAVASCAAALLWSPGTTAHADASGNACTPGVSVSQVSVGDLVWYDVDGDGVQGGALDQPLAGVVLTLVGPDGGPVLDVHGEAVGPAITDLAGYYEFVGLPTLEPGQVYTVTVDESTIPAGLVPTRSLAAGRALDSTAFSGTSGDLTDNGQCDETVDFGYTDPSGVDPVVEKPRQPEIRSMVSSTTASTGVRISDRVWVSGLEATDRVVVRWKLQGPAKAVKGGCAKVRWAGKPLRATGSFAMTGDGVYKTRKVKLTKVGCYTFSDTIAKTAGTRGAQHAPGHPAQTVRVFPKRTLAIHTGGAGYL